MALHVPTGWQYLPACRTVQFVHPVSKEMIRLTAPVPEGNLWNGFEMD